VINQELLKGQSRILAQVQRIEKFADTSTPPQVEPQR
jgi:hypothetical protein